MRTKVTIAVVLSAWLVYQFVWDPFDPKNIAGKRVLITGASSGIGEQLAYEYSKLGALVFITARRVSLLQTVAERCKELGAKQVEFYAGDMALSADRETVVREVKKRFGGLDHLYLNHGICNKHWWMGSRQNVTDLVNILNVNFVSHVDLTSLVLPMLVESRGNIGVTSSLSGKMGLAQMTQYAASKFALQGFFTAFRQELLMTGRDVSVTMCIIILTDTPMATLNGTLPEDRKSMIFGLIQFFDTAKDTAVAMMRAVANREREMYFGKRCYPVIGLHKVFPSFIEYLLSHILVSQTSGIS